MLLFFGSCMGISFIVVELYWPRSRLGFVHMGNDVISFVLFAILVMLYYCILVSAEPDYTIDKISKILQLRENIQFTNKIGKNSQSMCTKLCVTRKIRIFGIFHHQKSS